jgi:hypothetical protein
MSLSQIHGALANACLLFSLIIAGYGFLRYFMNQGIDGSYWGALAVGELLYLAQIGVGIALLIAGGPRPARLWVHVLYGSVLVLMYPAAYGFTRGRDGRNDLVIYALLGLFLAGISLRAMDTAAFG